MGDSKKNGGMRLEQFKEKGDSIKAKLVGIQGHWEDAAALMWATEMKRLGREPYVDDPDWNKLVDSKGNRLYGTKKTKLHGIWLKWKKPVETSFAESTVSDELAEALSASVGRDTDRSDVWEDDSPRAGGSIWNHPAIEDLFLDGYFPTESRPSPPGRACLAAFTSSAVLALHAAERMAAAPRPRPPVERAAVDAAVAALAELLAVLDALPGPSDLLKSAAALAGRRRPAGIARAAGIAAGGGGGLFGGRDEALVGVIERIAGRVRALGEGEVCMAPAGWVREDGTGRILVRDAAGGGGGICLCRLFVPPTPAACGGCPIHWNS